MDLGRLAEAEALLASVAATFERTLGPEHPSTLATKNNRGDVPMKAPAFTPEGARLHP